MNYVTILQTKRADVANDLERLREEVRRASDAIAVKEAQLRNLDDLLALEGGGGPTLVVEERRTSGNFLDTAYAILEDSQEGIHYRDLVEQLERRGVHVPGQDPAANLIAHITRDQRFVRTARGTYGIAGIHAASPATRRRRVASRQGGR